MAQVVYILRPVTHAVLTLPAVETRSVATVATSASTFSSAFRSGSHDVYVFVVHRIFGLWRGSDWVDGMRGQALHEALALLLCFVSP